MRKERFLSYDACPNCGAVGSYGQFGFTPVLIHRGRCNRCWQQAVEKTCIGAWVVLAGITGLGFLWLILKLWEGLR